MVRWHFCLKKKTCKNYVLACFLFWIGWCERPEWLTDFGELNQSARSPCWGAPRSPLRTNNLNLRVQRNSCKINKIIQWRIRTLQEYMHSILTLPSFLRSPRAFYHCAKFFWHLHILSCTFRRISWPNHDGIGPDQDKIKCLKCDFWDNFRQKLTLLWTKRLIFFLGYSKMAIFSKNSSKNGVAFSMNKPMVTVGNFSGSVNSGNKFSVHNWHSLCLKAPAM